MFFGCSPCCGGGCPADGKPRTDPADEGTWVPSGTWADGVEWTLQENPGDGGGETWFFYGSGATSRKGGGATLAEQQDWGNLCNWYSSRNAPPDQSSYFHGSFATRATRLPPDDAIVHVYSQAITVNVGPQTVASVYFWGTSRLGPSSEITSTEPAHDSIAGALFNDSSRNYGTVNGGATFNDTARNYGTVNGGATFNYSSLNYVDCTVNDGATFNDSSLNQGTVNGGATFNEFTRNYVDGTVHGSATFDDYSYNAGTVNDDATFNASSRNTTYGTVHGSATFDDYSNNEGTVNNGATFNDITRNYRYGTVNGGATFNDDSYHYLHATVNGGATFNDAACSHRQKGNFFAFPCSRKFVAHPTDLPTCNGTAPDGCANLHTQCGCG